jgi:hypothetical protein
MKKISYILIIIVMSVSTAFAKKDIRIFKSIEFKDLYYLSKFEIIDLTDFSIKDKNILIDINSLERVLNDMSMVKSFKLNEKDQNLLVSIVENQPAFPLCIRDGEKNLFAELDKDFHLISTVRIHLLNMPIIIVSQEEMKNKKVSFRLKYFLGFLLNLNKSGLGVMKEINEINYTDINNIKLSLKGRRTVFNIKTDKESFNKLNYAVGYFDRIKYYPHTFTILNNAGILE